MAKNSRPAKHNAEVKRPCEPLDTAHSTAASKNLFPLFHNAAEDFLIRFLDMPEIPAETVFVESFARADFP